MTRALCLVALILAFVAVMFALAWAGRDADPAPAYAEEM